MAGKNGGARPGAGRKPKADELVLIERLSPLDDTALEAMKKGIAAGEFPYVKMFFEYRFGKPKEKIEHSGEMGIIWNEIKNYGVNRKTDDSSGLSGG